MSMTISEPIAPKVTETYTQRRLRKERESEVKGRTKSKAELAAIERTARETALAKSLLESEDAKQSKGLKMMAKMGFKPGNALGKKTEGVEQGKERNGGRLEPIAVEMKEDRGGIGMDTEKKRKFREEMEGEVKRVKAEEGDYRERVRREREEARHEAQFQAAMRIAQRMSEIEEEKEELARTNEGESGTDRGAEIRRKISTRPLKSVNVLWRGLVKQREEKERDRRMRHDLIQSLSRLPTYEDDTEDSDDRVALGKVKTQIALVEDLEEDDPELDAFNELPVAQRLQKLVDHLRETYFYCFWCKFSYDDAEMEGCPGLTEEEHD